MRDKSNLGIHTHTHIYNYSKAAHLTPPPWCASGRRLLRTQQFATWRSTACCLPRSRFSLTSSQCCFILLVHIIRLLSWDQAYAPYNYAHLWHYPSATLAPWWSRLLRDFPQNRSQLAWDPGVMSTMVRKILKIQFKSSGLSSGSLLMHRHRDAILLLVHFIYTMSYLSFFWLFSRRWYLLQWPTAAHLLLPDSFSLSLFA